MISNMSLQDTKNKIIRALDEKKALDIVEFDLSKFSSKLSDSCIVASGTSSRHTQSVAEHIYKLLKNEHMHPMIEGSAKTGWVMIEASGIEIHLFKPESREYYDLESLLKDNTITCSPVMRR